MKTVLQTAEDGLEPKRMKAQFKYADKKGIPLVVIAGENEFSQGVWQVKDMKTGEQFAVPNAELCKKILELIG